MSVERPVRVGPTAATEAGTSRQGRLLLLLGKKKLLAAAPLLIKGGALKAGLGKGAAVGSLKGLGGLGGLAGLAGLGGGTQHSYVVPQQQQHVYVQKPVVVEVQQQPQHALVLTQESGYGHQSYGGYEQQSYGHKSQIYGH